MSYLLVKHWTKGTVLQEKIEKKDLLDVKDGVCQAIIQTGTWKFFDPEKNEWIDIKYFEGFK